MTVRTPRYPVEFNDAPLTDLVDAAHGDTGGWWREELLGGPFNKSLFLDVLQSELVTA